MLSGPDSGASLTERRTDRYNRLELILLGEKRQGPRRGHRLYDADHQQNIDAATEVAQKVRQAGLPPYEADVLAILGGLPTTNGTALRQAAAGGPVTSFDSLRQLALNQGAAGSCILGSPLTVEEAYARMAALGDPTSPEPIAFHAVWMSCPSRAQLMIGQLQQLGIKPQRAWAISPDPMMLDPVNDPLQLRPVNRDGSPVMDQQGQVIWPHHVCPAVEVQGAHGTTDLRVLDPSLLREPAALAGWHFRVDPRLGHSQQVTAPGVAPVDPGTGVPFPGTGFHASTYPEPADPTTFARVRMTTAFQQTPFQGLRWFDPNF